MGVFGILSSILKVLIVFQISKCINVIGTPKFMDFEVKVERGSDGTSYLGYNADH